MTALQRAAYHKGVVLLLETYDRLGAVKTLTWTQKVLLNDIYELLHESLEALADISPNDLSRQVRSTLYQHQQSADPDPAHGWKRFMRAS